MKIITESVIDHPQGFSRTKKFSVQSSFKLNLPPPLIFEASTIKLDETIGQGKNYNHNGQYRCMITHSILVLIIAPIMRTNTSVYMVICQTFVVSLCVR